MGYCTRYELHHTYVPEPVWVEGIDEMGIKRRVKVSDAPDRDPIRDLVAMLNFDPFVNECKWYNHMNDVVDLSKQYPGVLFTLHGWGEEPEDVWRLYVRDGECQRAVARLVFDAPTV